MQREILKKCHSPASARACGTSYPFKLSKTGVYHKTTRKMQMNLHLTTVCEFCPAGITGGLRPLYHEALIWSKSTIIHKNQVIFPHFSVFVKHVKHLVHKKWVTYSHNVYKLSDN